MVKLLYRTIEYLPGKIYLNNPGYFLIIILRMIKDTEILRTFENNLIKKEKLSYADSLRIFEMMWREASTLGILPSKDPLDGIETKIKISKILSLCSKNSSQK